MTGYGAQAIVLGFRDDREYDRLYTLLTREYGKVVVRGSGARRPTAKLAPHLDVLMHTQVAVARNRGRGTVTHAVCEEAFAALRADRTALGAALRLVAVADALLRDEDSHPAMYDTVLVCLHTLDALAAGGIAGTVVRTVAEGGVFHLLGHAGWRHVGTRCGRCGSGIAPAPRYVYGLADGGLLCPACTAAAAPRQTVSLSRDAAAALRVFAGNSIPSLAKLTVPERVCDELQLLNDRRVAWVS